MCMYPLCINISSSLCNMHYWAALSTIVAVFGRMRACFRFGKICCFPWCCPGETRKMKNFPVAEYARAASRLSPLSTCAISIFRRSEQTSEKWTALAFALLPSSLVACRECRGRGPAVAFGFLLLQNIL
jgi:hypothetical protein